MDKQVNKVLGLLVLGMAGVVATIFGLVFHILPAFLMVAFFGFLLAIIIYFITLTTLNFLILWLIMTIIVFMGLMLPSTKIEYKIRKNLEDEE